MGFEVERLTRAIGGLVSGIDLRKPLSESEFDALYRALLEYHVLFFRKQPLAPDEQVALAKRFGPIDIHAFGRHLETHPEVGLLDQTEPRRDGANRWHTDSTFMRTPPKMAILHAVSASVLRRRHELGLDDRGLRAALTGAEALSRGRRGGPRHHGSAPPRDRRGPQRRRPRVGARRLARRNPSRRLPPPRHRPEIPLCELELHDLPAAA